MKDEAEGDLEREFHLLTVPLSCLDARESREALGVARRLGRALAEREDLVRAGLRVYRQVVVGTADAADLLSGAARSYWRTPGALADGRVVSLGAGFALARARTRT
jgi:hypothetical protein